VHLLAAVAWIGGLFLFALVVMPGARHIASKTPDQNSVDRSGRDGIQGETLNVLEGLQDEIERRFTPVANLSLVVLIVTGMLQMSVDENYAGFLTFDNTWAWAMLAKHLAVLGMAVIAGYVGLVLEPERRRLQTLYAAGREDEAASRQLTRRRSRLLWLNLGCGLVTLLFTAIATAQ
jgi:uncharacterized membrane protein